MCARRASRVEIEAIAAKAAEPIFALDADWRVIYFNPACEKLTDRLAAQVLGLRCEYRGPLGAGDLPDLAASLAPPPEVFQGKPTTVRGLFVRETGEHLWRQIQFFPCHDAAGRLTCVLGLVSDRMDAPDSESTAPHLALHADLLAMRARLNERYGIRTIVGSSPLMSRVLEQVRLAAQSDGHLLIWGEPGTGKELIARAIHSASSRRGAAFVPLDCTLLPPELLDRDLFGSERDSDPASARGRPGIIRSAAGGTLFVKPLSRLPRDLQAHLGDTLGVAARRAASSSSGKPPMRLIAADESDPAGAVAAETVRPDLYLALSTLVIHLPPLRERKQDIPLLAQAFVEKANALGEKQLAGLSSGAIESLIAYDWPRNVRELEQVVSEAHAACPAQLIEPEHLTPRIQGALGAVFAPPPATESVIDLDAALLATERKLIAQAVHTARGNKSRAAALLGISRPRLYRRMEQLGMDGAGEAETEQAEDSPHEARGA